MRYSIIHHDIRQKFNLTISEYLVCDSIYQLSYSHPCSAGAEYLGNFLGLTERTVYRAIAELKEKKLIMYTEFASPMPNGYVVTNLWLESVLSATDKMSVKNRQNVSRSIYNNNNTSADAQNLSEKEIPTIVEVPSDSDGGAAEPRAARKKADTSYRQIFALFGRYPRNWDLNKTQIQAAKNLLAEHDLPLIRGALKFHGENRDKPFCPEIHSPYDLDSKWKKLAAFKKKLDN